MNRRHPWPLTPWATVLTVAVSLLVLAYGPHAFFWFVQRAGDYLLTFNGGNHA